MSTPEENARNIAVILEKIANLISNLEEHIVKQGANYASLQKSYFILNESHHKLEVGFAEMRAEWRTTKAWVKWVLGGSALTFIIGVVNLVKLFGWI